MILGQTLNLKIQVNLNAAWYGNTYGGFYVYPGILNTNSVVYSFGIGEDVSFDLAMINKHGCKVYAFDPTPKSIKWIEKQKLPAYFHFYPYGISKNTGFEVFYLPKNSENVSGSTIDLKNVNTHLPIEVPMMCMGDIIKQQQHSTIDVLKMDIEGSEYSILKDILDSNVEVKQFCIEFHHRMFRRGGQKTKQAIKLLKQYDYLLFKYSNSHEELSFIKRAYIPET